MANRGPEWNKPAIEHAGPPPPPRNSQRALLLIAKLILALLAAFGSYKGYQGLVGINQSPGSVTPLLRSLQDYAAAHGGQPPLHGLALFTLPGIAAVDVISPTSGTTPGAIAVAGTTLESVLLLPPAQRGPLADAAARALPPRVTAHRLGDVVFTYHGMNLPAADGALWVLVLWPDPASHHANARMFGGTILVGRADGMTAAYSASSFDRALAKQNALRAQVGLPPLPEPRDVLHGQPAAGP